MAENNCESRKRTVSSDREDATNEGCSSKVRAKPESEEDVSTVLVKVLVPSASAGVILGKGGETIIRLQTQYCTNIKMSKAGDFYPGTCDRVCVILGNPCSVRSLLDVLIDKIRDKPDAHGASTDQRIKLVVPNSTARMIMGKGGKCLNEIQKKASVCVQVSPKDDDQIGQERCITIQGNPQGMGSTLDLIMDKIISDPHSNSCPNVSYSEVHSASQYMSGSMTMPTAASIHTGIIPKRPSFVLLRNMLRQNGFMEPAIEEIVAAVYTLVSYGFLTLNGEGESGLTSESTASTGFAKMLGFGGGGGMQPPLVTSMNTAMTAIYSESYGNSMQRPMPNAVNSTVGYNANVPGVYGAIGGGASFYGGYGNTMGEYSNYRASPVSSAAYNATNSYAAYYANAYGSGTQPYFPASNSVAAPPPPPLPPAPASVASSSVNTSATDAATMMTDRVEVGEHIVGALLGPGGRNIVDLQTWSGATINISEKGIYAPGTTNRVVTVTGNPVAVYNAMYSIRQRIEHEEMQRSATWFPQPSYQPTVGVLHQQSPASDGSYYPPPGQAAR